MPSFILGDVASATTLSLSADASRYVSRSSCYGSVPAGQSVPYWLVADGIGVQCINPRTGKCIESVSVAPKMKFISAPVVNATHIFALARPSSAATPSSPAPQSMPARGDMAPARLWSWPRAKKQPADVVTATATGQKRDVGCGAIGLAAVSLDSPLILVLYCSGSFKFYDSIADTFSEEQTICSNASASVVWHEIQTAPSGQISIALALDNGEVVVASVSPTGALLDTHSATLTSTVTSYTAFAFNSHSQTVAVLCDDNSLLFIQAPAMAQRLFTITATGDQRTIEFVSSDYLAILSQASNDSPRITIVDTRSVIVRAERMIEQSSGDTQLSLRLCSQAQDFAYLLVSASSSAITAHSAEFSKPTLFDAIARQSVGSPAETESTLADAQDVAAVKALIAQKLSQQLNTDLAVNGAVISGGLPQTFVQQAVAKLLNNGFFCDETMAELIKGGLVSGGAVYGHGRLVSELICRGKGWLVHLALHHISDINERDIVAALSYSLKAAEEEMPVADQTELLRGLTVADGIMDESQRDFYLRSVISAPFSSAFLSRALRSLSTAEVKGCLLFAHRWLQIFDQMGPERVAAVQQGGTANVTYDTVLDFCTCLLDAHLTTLLLEVEMHSLLAEVYDLVCGQVLICNEMETMKGVLAEGEKLARTKPAKQRALDEKEVSRLCGVYGVERVQWW